MDSENQNQNQNVELLNIAINKLVEEKKNKPTSIAGDHDDDDDQLLLSQLESLKEQQQQENKQSESSSQSKPETRTEEEVENVGKQEIVKEINKIKRQNVVTHWLLSAMIVITVAWQISEVSLILKVKQGVSDGLRHPFKHLSGMLTRMLLKRPLPAAENGNDDRENNNDNGRGEVVPPLKIPELPHVEFPDLTHNG